MEFTVIKEISSDPIELVETKYKAILTEGVAEIFVVDGEGNKTAIVTQPWKNNSDGTRSDWKNLNEVVSWFKESAEMGVF